MDGNDGLAMASLDGGLASALVLFFQQCFKLRGTASTASLVIVIIVSMKQLMVFMVQDKTEDLKALAQLQVPLSSPWKCCVCEHVDYLEVHNAYCWTRWMPKHAQSAIHAHGFMRLQPYRLAQL